MFMAAKASAMHHPNAAFRSQPRPHKSAYPTTRMQTRIHRLSEDQGIVLMPGCYDALSAAIVQKTGFSAGHRKWRRLLGPSVPLLRIFPIIVDADTGGGNALNVQRTVKAGAAGCFLEVIPAEEHASKIASARDAIGDSDFFLVARTDARAKTGLSDAISRANIYMEAGADACFVEAPRDDDELKQIGQRTNGYRVCNMLEGGVTPLHTPEELKAMVFHLIVHPLTTIYASTRAIIDVLKTLQETKLQHDPSQFITHLRTKLHPQEEADLPKWYICVR
ncbi:hypothetical protein L1049_026464 [Liquidambar formosana]|uniref:Carboxyvinyl-carboxyphosphonate phosphorylmutase n=1 Tax=Liquidambar formosana TaxID=63359 RepID=A0AAP0NDR9_LIQFO